jgi:uncharacterized protein YodC (DUF2158 family)
MKIPKKFEQFKTVRFRLTTPEFPSPPMLVIEDKGPQSVFCAWFDKQGVLQTHTFPQNWLVIYHHPPNHASESAPETEG